MRGNHHHSVFQITHNPLLFAERYKEDLFFSLWGREAAYSPWRLHLQGVVQMAAPLASALFWSPSFSRGSGLSVILGNTLKLSGSPREQAALVMSFTSLTNHLLSVHTSEMSPEVDCPQPSRNKKEVHDENVLTWTTFKVNNVETSSSVRSNTTASSNETKLTKTQQPHRKLFLSELYDHVEHDAVCRVCFRKCWKPRSSLRAASEEERSTRYWWQHRCVCHVFTQRRVTSGVCVVGLYGWGEEH